MHRFIVSKTSFGLKAVRLTPELLNNKGKSFIIAADNNRHAIALAYMHGFGTTHTSDRFIVGIAQRHQFGKIARRYLSNQMPPA